MGTFYTNPKGGGGVARIKVFIMAPGGVLELEQGEWARST